MQNRTKAIAVRPNVREAPSSDCAKADWGLKPEHQNINTSRTYYNNMLKPEYYKVLLEIGVGRRFWQSNPSVETVDAFYVRVVKPLRQLQRRGVVEKVQEITAADDRTPIAVEIIGQVDLTKVRKQWGLP